ncbi:MAG: sulfur carrier protein ThiS [Prochlorococcaceae cyanobacterium]
MRSPGEATGPAGELELELMVNGERRRCPGGLCLERTLRALGYEPRLVVVELNGELLARHLWPERMVGQSDVLEVVTIVGGGS